MKFPLQVGIVFGQGTLYIDQWRKGIDRRIQTRPKGSDPFKLPTLPIHPQRPTVPHIVAKGVGEIMGITSTSIYSIVPLHIKDGNSDITSVIRHLGSISPH